MYKAFIKKIGREAYAVYRIYSDDYCFIKMFDTERKANNFAKRSEYTLVANAPNGMQEQQYFD